MNVTKKIINKMKRKSPENIEKFQDIKIIKTESHEKINLDLGCNKSNIINFQSSLEKVIDNFLDIKILKKYINKKNLDFLEKTKNDEKESNTKIIIENKVFKKIIKNKITNEKESDEKESDEKETDERKIDKKIIDEKTSDEKTSNEKDTYVKDTNVKENNEKETDEKETKEKEIQKESENKEYEIKNYKFYCKLVNEEKIKLQPLIEMIRNKEINKFTKIKYYPSDKNNNLGIFIYKDFIIRIDEVFDPFYGEMTCLKNMDSVITKEKMIVLPVYVGIQKDYYFSIQVNIKNSCTLYQWVRDKKIKSLESAIELCIKIGESISYLHSNNIVHGDIKPDNIMIIEEDKIIKTFLIDFGSAGKEFERIGTGGTKPYCHPKTENIEMLEMNNYKWLNIRKENDIWSLALIFFTLITTGELYYYYRDYPKYFFESDGFINKICFNMVNERYRKGFEYVLKDGENINIDNFLDLLRS